MKPEDDQLGIEQSGRTLAESVDFWNGKQCIRPLPFRCWRLGRKLLLCQSVSGIYPATSCKAHSDPTVHSIILAVTGREQWNLYKGAHAVNFAIGFAGLVCLSLYSNDYHDHEVTTENEENAGERLNVTPYHPSLVGT
jgi:hypothetical protein